MVLSDFFPNTRILRDAEIAVTMPLDSQVPGSIAYLSHWKFADAINRNKNITAVICGEREKDLISSLKGLVLSQDPARDYYLLHNELVSMDEFTDLVPSSSISSKANIHESCVIFDNVIIEDEVVIGPYCIIESNTIIRNGSFLDSHVRIGGKGMQNARIDGGSIAINYVGGVLIEEGCEILSGALIQKPYQKFFTTIGQKSQISVNVSVGHGSSIGKECQLAGRVTVAGNVKMGNNCWVGPASTIADGLTVGDNARILVGSVVVTSVNNGQSVSGNFAVPHGQQLKNLSKIRKL